MANDVLALGSYAGYYNSSSDVNGKPSFISGKKAIWYDVKFNNWKIGEHVDLGSSRCYFHNTKFKGLTDDKNTWKYWNNGWKTAGPNDVNIQCLLEGKLHTYNISKMR